MARYEAFEKLAQQEVGLPGSRFVFVSVGHEIQAVFVKSRGGVALDVVVDFAASLGEKHPVIVEDSTGIAWENQCSEKEQQSLQEEEDD